MYIQYIQQINAQMVVTFMWDVNKGEILHFIAKEA